MLSLLLATVLAPQRYRAIVLYRSNDGAFPYQLLDNGDALLNRNLLWHDGQIRKLRLPSGLPEYSEVQKIGPHGEYAIGASHVESGALSVSVDQAYLYSNSVLKDTGSMSAFICDITNTGKLLWYDQDDYSSAGYPPPDPAVAYMLLPNGKNVKFGVAENLRVNKKGVIAYDVPYGRYPVHNIEPETVTGPVRAVNPFYATQYGAYTLFKGKVTTIGPGIVADINERGTVVGYALSPEELSPGQNDLEQATHVTGWIWTSGRRTEVRSSKYPHIEVLAINNRGAAVGMMGHAFPDLGQAFIYTNGKLVDLNNWVRLPYGLVLRRAVEINDRGDILCEAQKTDDDPTVPVLLKR